MRTNRLDMVFQILNSIRYRHIEQKRFMKKKTKYFSVHSVISVFTIALAFVFENEMFEQKRNGKHIKCSYLCVFTVGM